MSLDELEKSGWTRDVSPEEMRRIVDALYRVHRLVASVTDLDALLERIMEESREVADAEACSLMLYDEKTSELYFHVALGDSGDQQSLKREIRLKIGQGVAGICAQDRVVINVPDAKSDPRIYKGADEVSRFDTRSLLATPLVEKEELIGVIEVLNKRGGGPFTHTDVRVLQMFASLSATVISNARLVERSRRAERLAAVGEAVASMSHFAKNIITALTSSADLIDQSLHSGQFDALQRSWPIFRRSTRRIANCVSDMLVLAKPRKPLIKSCDIGDILQDARDTVAGLLVHKSVRLDMDYSRIQEPIQADAQGLFRCLINLLLNASDAVPDHDGRIKVTAFPSPEDQLEIWVEDNGPGITPEDARRVFDPFFSTKGNSGTGLGLSATRKIIQEHGGSIVAEAGELGGARFRIVMPLKAELQRSGLRRSGLRDSGSLRNTSIQKNQ